MKLVVIGAGIVGLAAARALSRRKGVALTVVDKEPEVGAHQSGHNSGVLHSGVYYQPGSEKARLCTQGREQMVEFCRTRGVGFRRTGKVIVALDDGEREQLERIRIRGVDNGVGVRLLSDAELRDTEPHVRGGATALFVPEAGIVDYPAVCRALAAELRDSGHGVVLGRAAVGVDGLDGLGGSKAVRMADGTRHPFDMVVVCAGAYSDRWLRWLGGTPDYRIVPFRGEYATLAPAARHLCKGLIYPVPDPRFPFLGVHLTATVAGEVECGPNAVLALSREGYRWGDIDLADSLETACYGGFWSLALRHIGPGVREVWRSMSRRAFWRSVTRLVPELAFEHMLPGGSGVRAQALRRDGTLVDDFVIERGEGYVHVGNAPSPAATASLAIGQVIAGFV